MLPACYAVLEPPRSGRLRYDRFLPADPAAGAPLIFPLDAAFDWLPIHVSFNLATDANASNRVPTVDATDAEGTVWWSNGQSLSVTANQTAKRWSFGLGRPYASTTLALPAFVPLMPVWIPGGWQLRINLFGVQVGDQISSVRIYTAMYASGPAD